MALPKNGDFSKLLGSGENPNGMISQTPNGTYRNSQAVCDYRPPYWGPDSMDAGPRWNENPMCEPMIEAGYIQIPGHRRRSGG